MIWNLPTLPLVFKVLRGTKVTRESRMNRKLFGYYIYIYINAIGRIVTQQYVSGCFTNIHTNILPLKLFILSSYFDLIGQLGVKLIGPIANRPAKCWIANVSAARCGVSDSIRGQQLWLYYC
jgi:hypothetical protein